MLLVVATITLIVGSASARGDMRRDLPWALSYLGNWGQILGDVPYYASDPPLLRHLWSLAIEEQFYLLWPLVFVGLLAWWKRSTPMAVLVTSLVLACLSSALMFVLYDEANLSRVYYGTDTRAAGILLGAALAAWLAVRGPVKSRAARVALEIAALVGVVVLAVAWSSLGGQSHRLYQGGFLLCGLAVVAVLAAAAHPRPGPVAQVLSWRPLTALGIISYGVYLWHWPVDVVLNPSRTHLRGWWLFGVQTAVTLLIAGISYKFLEQPIRRGALSPRQWRALTPAVAAGLVLVLVTTAGARTHPAGATTPDAIAREIASATHKAKTAPPGTQRVMVVGNSVAYFLGEAVKQIPTEPPIVVLNTAMPACLFPPNNGVTPAGGNPEGANQRTSPSCSTSWPLAVERFRPQVVLWILSGGGTAQLNGRWVHSCDTAYDRNFERYLRKAITTLGAGGAKVVLTTAAYNRYLLNWTTDGAVRCDNRVRRKVAAATNTPIIDLFSRICPNDVCHTTENGVTLRRDGVHYEGAGGRIVAGWLIEQLRAKGLR
jgi:peptidoglycan/LPS O-acetylase OafA/YrhL